MEEIIRAIILGLVQGITEFLPISSSGHLEIFNKILSEKHQENMTMTVVLHFATALSTLVVFKTDVFSIFNGLIKKRSGLCFFFCKNPSLYGSCGYYWINI